ncbi:GNAT family N-acetyltransferase [Acanthopleuribacter pedis]|uniref:GNAT family N-acetyltransferase n=1 Tax=Acanthopleuribacter pedis TaxID=442870 RepID=A0A8J7QA56_9BACT|nr:GNAT family N-acetyltransferase [Acanthopleuribacter pedis]
MNETNQVNASEPAITIRAMQESDRAAVLLMARELVAEGDTYAFDAAISDAALWAFWCPSAHGRGYVLVRDGEVIAMYMIRRNHAGPGGHIGNAGYAVRRDCRGQGLGGIMGRRSLDHARELGFKAMQFNIVLASNTAAVRAWLKLGFDIKGTIPDGFQLPDGSYTDFHIMYRRL